MSPYLYCAANPIKFIDPDGKEIVLGGTNAQKQQTLSTMQKLTNDVLGMARDGRTVMIRSLGGANGGRSLSTGTNMIRDLNKKGDGAKTVGIITTTEDSGTGALNPAGATNGNGTDVRIEINLTQQPDVVTQDAAGIIRLSTISTEIVLGHELVHADRSMNGVAADYNETETYDYTDRNGNKTELTAKKEEFQTVGIKGNYKYTENKLRKEHNLNPRVVY